MSSFSYNNKTQRENEILQSEVPNRYRQGRKETLRGSGALTLALRYLQG